MALYGKISDVMRQAECSSFMSKGFEYLLKFDPMLFKGKEPGFSMKTSVLGQSIYASHQVYFTKSAEEARFESHRNFIDIQVVWSGEEIVSVVPDLNELSVCSAYDEEKDIEFYEYFRSSDLILKRGLCAVFYPADAHAPCLSNNARRRIVAKTVVKVKVR